MKIFEWPVRVYYEDTDAGGVVYYANYLKFMERARSEWLRALGVEQDHLRRDAGVLLMVHSLSIRYVKSAKFNAHLRVSVEVKHLGKAKVTFVQRVTSGDMLLCEGEATVACVNEQSGRPCAFPQLLQQAFEGV